MEISSNEPWFDTSRVTAPSQTVVIYFLTENLQWALKLACWVLWFTWYPEAQYIGPEPWNNRMQMTDWMRIAMLSTRGRIVMATIYLALVTVYA